MHLLAPCNVRDLRDGSVKIFLAGTILKADGDFEEVAFYICLSVCQIDHRLLPQHTLSIGYTENRFCIDLSNLIFWEEKKSFHFLNCNAYSTTSFWIPQSEISVLLSLANARAQ